MPNIIYLRGIFNTNFEGIDKLYNVYKALSKYTDTKVHLDFTELEFIDGNLCALLSSMLHQLHESNRLTFEADFDYVEKYFNVLCRNGFIPVTSAGNMPDSTIGLKMFDVTESDKFVDYIENDLLAHWSMKLTKEEMGKIFDCMIEIFTNVELHAKSKSFYVCGQYFADDNMLKFTMVDRGRGFLPAIKSKTKGEIKSAYDAIKWALKRSNTTKQDAPGGLGLPTLIDYFENSNGSMQIITGNVFWSSENDVKTVNYQNFVNPCVGTMINLLFSYN